MGVDGIGGEETDNGELDEDGDAECWNELKDEDGSGSIVNRSILYLKAIQIFNEFAN